MANKPQPKKAAIATANAEKIVAEELAHKSDVEPVTKGELLAIAKRLKPEPAA